MNRRIFEIIDELTQPEHHWSWYQLNGKSAYENLEIQRAEWHKEFLGRQLKELLYAEEAAWAAESTKIEFTIKSEVK
jgi:hypothetical protein